MSPNIPSEHVRRNEPRNRQMLTDESHRYQYRSLLHVIRIRKWNLETMLRHRASREYQQWKCLKKCVLAVNDAVLRAAIEPSTAAY